MLLDHICTLPINKRDYLFGFVLTLKEGKLLKERIDEVWLICSKQSILIRKIEVNKLFRITIVENNSRLNNVAVCQTITIDFWPHNRPSIFGSVLEQKRIAFILIYDD